MRRFAEKRNAEGDGRNAEKQLTECRIPDWRKIEGSGWSQIPKDRATKCRMYGVPKRRIHCIQSDTPKDRSAIDERRFAEPRNVEDEGRNAENNGRSAEDQKTL